MLDLNRKLAFFHPSRTGGTSVEQMIIQKYNQSIWKFNARKVEGIQYWLDYGDKLEEKKYNIQHADLTELKIPEGFTSFATVRNPYHRAISMYSYYEFDKTKIKTFEEFYKTIGWSKWKNPQHFYTHKNYIQIVDKIVRICDGEKVNVEWLSKTLDCPLVDINKRPKKIELIASDIKFINEIYRQDFEFFGYPMKTPR